MTGAHRPELPGDPGPADVHAWYEELQRLLLLRPQTPLGPLLRERFLRRAVLPRGGPYWTAYGVNVAAGLAEDTLRLSPEDLSPPVAEEVLATLERCALLPVPEHAGAARWLQAWPAAAARLRGWLENVEADGEDPAFAIDASAEPAGHRGAALLVPVVLRMDEVDPGHPIFGDAQAGLLLRIHVTAHASLGAVGRARLSIEGECGPDARAAFEAAVDAVLRERVRGAPGSKRTWFRLRWEPTAVRLDGRSAALPCWLAARAAREELVPSILLRVPAWGLAATGDLDGAAAAIVPVDATSLAEKVRACFRGRAAAVIVPAAQRPGALAEAARLQATLPERQLLVLGGRTPAEIWQDARLWKVRQRRPRELLAALAQRLASSRAVLAGLLSLLLAAGGIAGWEAWLSRPDPATVEWQDGTLVVRNPSGRVCFVHAPEGSADQLAALFHGAPGMARVADLHPARGREVLAVPADVRSPAARLVLFGPRGRPHWDLPASRVAPTIAEEREDLRWWTVLVPAAPAGEPAVVAMRRSPQRSLCLIDCRRGRDGALLGLVGSHGHVEILIATDLDGDAREEIVAGGQVNDSAGHALLVALDPVRMRFDPVWTHVESLPRIGEPAALRNGVRWAVRVERDRWTSSLRTAFQDLSREEGGQLRAFAAADSGVGYNYYFDLTDAAAPRLVEVAMTDAYRAALTRWFGPTLTPEDVEAERSRLESAAEGLTPEGWRPLRPVAAGKAP